MPWLSLTLEVGAEHADALSDALLEAGAHSVALGRFGSPTVTLEALVARDAPIHALLDGAARAAGLRRTPKHVETLVEDEDWVRRSQSQFEPIAIESRLWIVPTWHEVPAAAAGGVVVRLDPGLAFGTGTHPSTRLALEFLARRLKGGERVLDYGCGSGILAISAAKLGAGEVVAVDIDPAAVSATAENASRNGVSVEALSPEALGPGVYDVVVANILAQPLIVLAPLLAAHTRSGGHIALSGILESQADEVAQAYAKQFTTGKEGTLDGWAVVAGLRA